MQIGNVLMNYLKNLSMLDDGDKENKKERYLLVVKYIEMLRKFKFNLILISTGNFANEYNLTNIVNNMKKIKNKNF